MTWAPTGRPLGPVRPGTDTVGVPSSVHARHSSGSPVVAIGGGSPRTRRREQHRRAGEQPVQLVTAAAGERERVVVAVGEPLGGVEVGPQLVAQLLAVVLALPREGAATPRRP